MNTERERTLVLPLIGLAASAALTLAAYVFVSARLLSGNVLLFAIMALALAQLIVQMTCFLDLGFGAGSLWRTATFVATVGLVAIIVAGSVWIMSHLNYDMMASPDDMMRYIQAQQGF